MSKPRSYVIQPKPTAAPVITRTIESESLLLIPVQKGAPGELILSSEQTAQIRSSRLVGFDRGAGRLQPFVRPKEF